MYEFWYDYVKLKYKSNANLCFMDTDSFIVYVKTKKIWRHCRWCKCIITFIDKVIAIKREKVMKKCLLKWGFKFED